MNPPAWADKLAEEALVHLNKQPIKATTPPLRWMSKPWRAYTSGVTYSDHISIVAGNNRIDARLVLLHELAHWVLPRYGSAQFYGHEGHTPEFWDIAWMLYRWNKLPINYCKQREGEYRKEALIAYHKALKKI